MSRSNQLAGLITATPTATLDTINEINTSLNNDANLSTTLTNSINAKANKSGDTFTGALHVQKSSTGISGSNDDVLTLEKDAETVTINMISDTDRKSNIIFSDTTRAQGRVQFDQSNRQLSLWTSDASPQLLIDTSGKVGIGTDAPSDLNSAANDLVVKNTGNAGITIFSGSTSSGNLFFADATSGTAEYDGFLQYSQNDQKLDIGTAGASRVTIDSSGNLETTTTGKVKQKGAFMQSSTHQALVLGY